MGDIPSLISLCMKTISKAAASIDGYNHLQDVFYLPSDLFDALLSQLSPLAVEKLQAALAFNDSCGSEVNRTAEEKKRGRYDEVDRAWEILFKLRWTENDGKILKMNRIWAPDNTGRHDNKERTDWRQRYWESHLQECLDEASEKALLPSFEGCIEEINVPNMTLELIGYSGEMHDEGSEYVKLSYHCQNFGKYARHLRLQNALCVAGMSEMLRGSQLQDLIFRNIKCETHVDEVSKILLQNKDTLQSLTLVHCRFSAIGFEKLCSSIYQGGTSVRGIQYLSIISSYIFESKQMSAGSSLLDFLSSARSLRAIKLCDVGIGSKMANRVFDTLCRTSSDLTSLDISDDNIAGWLSKIAKESTCFSPEISSWPTILKSLCVLNLRGNNLGEDDAKDLKYVLLRMPHLRRLDISDNPLTDAGLRNLIPYFTTAIDGPDPLSEIKIENCGLSSSSVVQLLENVQSLNRPLHSLSLADNNLGSCVGVPLASFLGPSRLKRLNIEDVGLGPLGFDEFQRGLPEQVELIWVNMSKNRGRMKAAEFMAKLISRAPYLSVVNAQYNFLPAESLPLISEAVKLSTGKLERVDLTGNAHLCKPSPPSDLQFRGKPILILPSSPSAMAYDDDP